MYVYMCTYKHNVILYDITLYNMIYHSIIYSDEPVVSLLVTCARNRETRAKVPRLTKAPGSRCPIYIYIYRERERDR